MKLYPFFEDYHPGGKIIFFTFIVLVSFIAVLIGTMLIAIPAFGIGFTEIADHTDPLVPGNLPFLKFFQGMQSFGLFILPPLIAGFVFHKQMFSYLKVNKIPALTFVGVSFTIMLISIPIINFTAYINSLLQLPEFLSGLEISMKEAEESAKVITEAFLTVDSTSGLLINLLIIAVLPAIGEELLFRGVLQKHFAEWFKNPHIAIWVTAVIFSFIHFQFYGFLPRMLMGALFGYLFYWSKNLWYPIIAHFVNNAAAVLAFYFYHGTEVGDTAETFGTSLSDFLWVLISVILISGMLFYFKKALFVHKKDSSEKLIIKPE